MTVLSEMKMAAGVLKEGAVHEKAVLTNLGVLERKFAWTDSTPVTVLMPSELAPGHWWISPYRGTVVCVHEGDLKF